MPYHIDSPPCIDGARFSRAAQTGIGGPVTTKTTRTVPGAEAPLPGPAATDDAARLAQLFARGTPENTQIAYERDMAYAAAWKQLAFGAALEWPERREVAARFILDHSEPLGDRPRDDPHRRAMETLVRRGLRRSLAPPAPSTLRRWISTWRTMHRLRGLASPFEDPLIRTELAKSGKANARAPRRKSANPVTIEVLEEVLAALPADLPGLRDRALFLFAWASGGRRPSEVAGLHLNMLDFARFRPEGIVDTRLAGTKTTEAGETPRLLIRGAAASAMRDWLDAARIRDGWVFRRIDRAGRLAEAPLTPAGVNHILKTRLEAAGYDRAYASAHGFRSGFLTSCAKFGVPLAEAMRLTLHRSVRQAVAYYQEHEVDGNSATRLLERTGRAGPGD